MMRAHVYKQLEQGVKWKDANKLPYSKRKFPLIKFIHGDGHQGRSIHAPFDRILITAGSAPRFPQN